jgi:transcription initiation factor TFIID TATA-box-binding protein
VFPSGVIHVSGATSEDDAKVAARKVARKIQKLGFDDVGFKKYKVQCVIGYADLGYPVDVEQLVTVHKQFASYEHELNPAAIYKMVEPRVVLNIFPSGKVMINGAKSVKDMHRAFDNVYPILKGCKKVKRG